MSRRPGEPAPGAAYPPCEPPPSEWSFPDLTGLPLSWQGHDLIATGADLAPGTLLAAYRGGLFPMRAGRQLGWWSPDPRGVLPLDRLRVSRSLRASMRRYSVTFDQDFAAVITACAQIRRPGRWITRQFVDAYQALHELGWAHSVEVWSADGSLAGGLYGVAAEGLFAGESMFHLQRDASKVALAHLVRWLHHDGQPRLLDVQWNTPHLASLGVVDVPRPDYLALLADARQVPQLPPPPAES